MSSNVMKFSDAVYSRQSSFDFGRTEFTRRELKVLLAIDGDKTVAQIADLLSSDAATLMTDFAKLVKLGLIQTDCLITSAGVSDLIFNDTPSPTAEYTIARMPSAIIA